MPTYNILIIGGSGFVSGTLARAALNQGHQVWTMTRGQRPVPEGVTSLVVDRKDQDAFEKVVTQTKIQWDLVVDCIGYDPVDARQDIVLFRDRAEQFVFISTDFVYEPSRRRFPQGEESDHYLTEGYGGKKRLCELEFLNGETGGMAWTIVRPCHIYGPGSLLGCLPLHGRDPELIAKVRRGETLKLVGGGHFLQQPILAGDLAALILSVFGNEACNRQIYCAAGPDVVESRTYYRLIADILGVTLSIAEAPVDQHLAAQPGSAPFLCHRIYDLTKLQSSGLTIPSTPIEQGLAEHVESLLS